MSIEELFSNETEQQSGSFNRRHFFMRKLENGLKLHLN